MFFRQGKTEDCPKCNHETKISKTIQKTVYCPNCGMNSKEIDIESLEEKEVIKKWNKFTKKAIIVKNTLDNDPKTIAFLGYLITKEEPKPLKNKSLEVNSLEKLLEEEKAFLFFTAKWCGPCLEQKRNIDEEDDFFSKNVKYYEIDADESNCKRIVEHFKIRSVPTSIFLKKGNIDKLFIGNIPIKELKEDFLKFSEN